MFGVDTADGSRHRAFRIGVPARFPAGRPAAPHGGKAAMAGSHALRGFPILLEWESRMEEGWRPEIPHPQGFPPCRNLLWQRAAGSPASVGFSPIRATAGSAGRRKPHTRGGCPFPRVRMEGASPSSAGGFPTPEIYRSLTQRKPRNPQFFSESPFKVGEGLQEAPPLQGFTVPAGEAFFSFPVDGLHRFSPASADEAQPSVGSPTRKDSPLDRAGKERVKVGSPASAKIHPHRDRSAPLHRGSPHP